MMVILWASSSNPFHQGFLARLLPPPSVALDVVAWQELVADAPSLG